MKFSGLKSIIIAYFSIQYSKIKFFEITSKNYRIRCYFDFKLGFSASYYMEIQWSPKKFLTFLYHCVTYKFRQISLK